MPENSEINPFKIPVLKYDDNCQLTQIDLSTSVISRFIHNGEKLDYCPKKNYETVITKKYWQPPTEKMLEGLFLEQALIGRSNSDDVVDDLPRDKRNGNKKTAQIRLEKHIADWDNIKEQHGIIVTDTNVQVKHKLKWENDYFDNVYIGGTADLISPFKGDVWWHDKFISVDYEMAIIDIKKTDNLINTFGDYCWGDYDNMDKFQLVLYARIFGLPTLYYVFDTTKELRRKAYHVPIDDSEGLMLYKECEQTIDKMIQIILFYEKNGWVTNPSQRNCKNCPVNCESKF